MTLSNDIVNLIDQREQQWIADHAAAASRADELAADLADARGRLATSENRAELAETRLRAAEERVRELETLPRVTGREVPGWTLLHDVDLRDPKGWELRRETQSNDNSYNTPDNVRFGDAGLTIFGRRQNLGNRPYTTGDALGRHISIPNYARVEFVAQLPTFFGAWSGVWLRPNGSSAGEIDLVETWPHDWAKTGAKVWSTIWNDYSAVNPYKKENASLAYSKLPNPDPAAPHSYVMEKTPGKIRFEVDGVLVYEWAKPNLNRNLATWWDAIFERPTLTWYPRVTIQLGGPNTADPKPEWTEGSLTLTALRVWTPS